VAAGGGAAAASGASGDRQSAGGHAGSDEPGGLNGLLGAGVELGWAASGVPLEEELLRVYCSLAGRPLSDLLPHWSWYKSMWFFKYAVIAQGVAARAVGGVASSAQARTVGELAPQLAMMAVDRTGLTEEQLAATAPPATAAVGGAAAADATARGAQRSKL
jgi:hypothetical protein